MKDELLYFLNKAFDMTKPDAGFQKLLPKLYGPKVDPCPHNLILKKDEHICAAVGAYDGLLHLGNASLSYRGIGNVAVDADCRNRGYMKQAMTQTIQKAVDDKIDFLVLGGQRQRYQYFGFDNLGMEYRATITKVNLSHAYREIPFEPLEIRDLTENDSALLEEIYQLHERKVFHSHRERTLFYEILCSWNAQPKVILKKGGFAGYFINDLQELMLKDPHDFPDFIRTYMQEKEDDEVEITIMPWNRDLLSVVRTICDNIDVCENDMFHILNYKNVLQVLLQHQANQVGLVDGEQYFYIHGYSKDVKLHISVHNNTVNVIEFDEADSFIAGFQPIECTHFEAMELILGIYSQKRMELVPNVRSWFPIPFAIESADQV